MDSIIGDATRTDIKHPNLPIQTAVDKVDVDKVQKLSFAEPGDIVEMARFFGARDGEVLSSEFLDKIHSIHDISKKFDMQLQDFLTEVSLKVGGRYSEGFLDKAYSYLRALDNEMVIEQQLRAARAETNRLGNPQHGTVTDILQGALEQLKNGFSNRNPLRG